MTEQPHSKNEPLAPAEPDPGDEAGALMVANRLRRNQARLKGWHKQQKIECYRLYDADLPEYAAAIDCYRAEDGAPVRWHVQEYAAPRSVPAELARQRFRALCEGLKAATGADDDQLALKARQIGKGGSKYGRLADRSEVMVVREGDARLEVNLYDYLDTGLFLDHRSIRRTMASRAQRQPGLHCANLFCYTGSASVQLALAGASTVNVDLSTTYLDWAKRNFALNAIGFERHLFLRADVMHWLRETQDRFDLIFCDPPTFSNSKRAADFDVQRDHPQLLQRALNCLKPGGLLVFSNNSRRFRMSPEIKALAQVTDITDHTFDRDFARNKRIHVCFELRAR